MSENNPNMVTYKVDYHSDKSILIPLKQYNSVLRYTYNRKFEDKTLTTKDITKLQKSLNNCDLINSWLKASAIYDAKELVAVSPNKQVVFGGKYLFKQRCKNKITKDEFQLKKLRPLTSIGEAMHNGNRLFQIIDENTILFKLNKNNHFILNLENVGNKRKKDILRLKELQDNCITSITYKLDLNCIYISFDYNALQTYEYKVKKNRVIAIDLNPNSIGWSVVDWKGENDYYIIQSGTFSLKPLNDYRKSKHVASDSKIATYVTNKRNHEVIEIARQLFKLTKHYKCEVFSIEDLNIPARNNKKGKAYNRLVNNMWNRNLIIQQIRKLINASSTTLVEIQPQYNSYIGNLVFRSEQLPDECLASIEIGRRGFEFATQYLFNRRQHKKVVVFPDLGLVKQQLAQSLEELSIVVPNFNSWKIILTAVKKSKVKYRFSTSRAQKAHEKRLFSEFYKHKYCIINTYL